MTLYDDEQNVVYITNTKGSYIEVIDPMNDEDNTNPRNLFWQDFSVLDPNPLAEEWYTGEDEVPDEITEALGKEPGYIGENITIETANFITTEENDPARKGLYDLSEGSFTQYFEFDKEKEVACFYNDVGFKSDTGRIAVMLESKNITADDLYLGLNLCILNSRLQGVPKIWWHKVFDGKAIIVFDGLDADSYYSMWVQNVMDPDGDVDSVSAVMTIAEF